MYEVIQRGDDWYVIHGGAVIHVFSPESLVHGCDGVRVAHQRDPQRAAFEYAAWSNKRAEVPRIEHARA